MIEDSFSVADIEGDAHAVLAQLRTRLLDLTLTNRLINFKHGARTVRVIDELPDQLFARLRNGDELEFLPVPEPPVGHPAVTRAGRGSAKHDRQKGADAYARELGLKTEFELPSPIPGNAPDRHTDAAIQTLLFPTELEHCLRNIASEARSAIEEKGSNILYLVFGFLEWRESDDSAKSISSPLLMLPLTLRKGEPDRKTGAYRFYISYSGEDVLPNISLQEKLRRDFQVTIPDFEESEAPESYLARIARDVALRPNWKVRREISLGLLLFTKLLMYRDLDPANWPEGSSPAQHPRLAELFGGGSPANHSDYATEYDFEATSSGGAPAVMPPIVMDADSSQHSAIVDAMAGRSFVIEGPPGTGKSQTIANLIAAALGSGKSVLFVADKLTALEVVGRRLDDVGLGVFCLELHSDKTQKSRLMEDVAKRLATRGKFRDPATLDERLGILQSARDSLNAYAALVNKPFGSLGWTIHEILWGAQRRRSALGKEAAQWAVIALPDTPRWRLAQFEELQRAATSFGETLAALRSRGPAESHPFRGIALTRLTPDAEENVLRTLSGLDELCERAASLFQAADAEIGAATPRDTDGLRSWMAALSTLATEAQGCFLEALPRLSVQADRRSIATWCDDLEAYVARRQHFSAAAPDARARGALVSLSPEAISFFRPDTTLDELRQTADRVPTIAALFGRADALVAKVGNLLEDDPYPRSLNALDLAVSVIALASSAPFAALAFRPRTRDAIAPALEAAASKAAALRADRAELGQAFDLANLPALDVLERCATTCATAGFFSFLSGEYRAAKRQFILLAQGNPPVDSGAMAAAFKRLAAHERQVAAFNANEPLKAMLGPCFMGLDTNFEGIEASLRWQEKATALQRRHRALTRRIEPLANASPDHLREIAELEGDAQQIRVTEVATVLERALAARDLVLDRNAPFASLLGVLTESATRARPLVHAADLLDRTHAVHVAHVSALAGVARELVAAERSLEAAGLPRSVLQAHHRGLGTPVEAVRRTVACAEAVFAGPAPEALRRYFHAKPALPHLEAAATHLRRADASLSSVLHAEARFVATADVVASEWYGANGTRTFAEIAARTARAVGDRDSLPAWVGYLRARAALSKIGLDEMRFVSESNAHIDLATLRLAAEFIFYQCVARCAFDAFPALSGHDGLQHTAIRERFRKYDQEIIRLERERLACRIDVRPVPPGITSSVVKNRTELALLEHEITKQKRHLPIRQLVNRAGGALLALKPCFMMSPRSVAQYLEGGRHAFDLVVMDEASQLRPEDAIGAIARGKQVVVVGDSKQLPPTSFFSSSVASNEDDDGEELITENKESILDLARTSYRPSRQLRWHYRSRHGSLIAFSNARYYGDSLVVFPGPRDKSDDLGVRLVQVEGATYADGQNKREAERVTEAVIEHLKTRPEETFGVVALNIRQKTLIEAMVHDRLKDEPELRKRYERAGESDGAFIKNLESVQGDERDVIYISVTYGPSIPGGRVARRFGPMNGANGWRRLNVLFTRAKLRVVVFASFTPDQLDGGELTAGVQDLRDYLAFARTGQYQQSETTEREPDSDFEVEVADALRNLGYGVTPQVGVAGYFIDMAVRSPRRAGEFVLGVECDGATYHSSFSARDRDRLRQQILEGLGWKIHRIWSTDWFRDPRSQTERLHAAIRAAEA